ncbi:hypothetical protein TrVFT333_007905 [Trichoderma virens FT-333]|nr:hypothetical protein TrVFT333_007905 [Trichoderma virens FT-333]
MLEPPCWTRSPFLFQAEATSDHTKATSLLPFLFSPLTSLNLTEPHVQTPRNMAAARDTSSPGDDAARYSFLRHMRERSNPELDEGRLNDFYDFVMSQQHGEQILESIVRPEYVYNRSVTLQSDFNTSTYAAGSLLPLIFYDQLHLEAHDVKKSFTGHTWGLVLGIPGGAVFGTLFYNDIAELEGECSLFIGVFSQYVYANFWKNNTQIATYHSGMVGDAVGGSWGTGEWSNES